MKDFFLRKKKKKRRVKTKNGKGKKFYTACFSPLIPVEMDHASIATGVCRRKASPQRLQPKTGGIK